MHPAQLHNACRKVFALQHLGKVEELVNLEGVLNALPRSLAKLIYTGYRQVLGPIFAPASLKRHDMKPSYDNIAHSVSILEMISTYMYYKEYMSICIRTHPL